MSTGSRYVRPSLDQIPPAVPSPRLAPDTTSLGLNEGLEGPFPAALAAMAAALPSLNRYPGRGSAELVAALAERTGAAPEQVLVAAGADAVIGYVCQATLQADDEVVVPWPSFPSFVRDAQRRDAVPVTVSLANGAVDLDATLAAVTPRTRLVFVATPNNPTGLALTRDDLVSFVRALPEQVLAVVDEAYLDYLDPVERADAVRDLLLNGDDVVSIRTFSKLYGLAGLRIGYGIGPADVVTAMRKVQRSYDVGVLGQIAALASLDDEAEVERRRLANAEAVAALTELLRSRGLEPLAGSATNFVLVDVGLDANEATAALGAHGVSVQSGAPFGAPTSLRIGAGGEDDRIALANALDAAGLSAR